MGKPITCPFCGWEMRKGDIRPGAFRCPGCKELLKLQQLRGRELVAAIVLACLIPYLAGARDIALVMSGVFLYFLILSGYGLLRGLLFPKLDRAPGDSTHIILPPDSPGSSGSSGDP